jgi:hypothetical protein
MQNLNPNPRRRASLSRTLSGIALINVLMAGLTAPAAQAPPDHAVPVNRWLIIVDTSRGMEPRTEPARQIAGILVLSGMNGQMHRGDTIGLWTFNQSLYAGAFPLQDYRPETARTTAQRVVTYLQEQPNEKSSRLEKVMPEVDKLVKASEFITVVIISDGSSKISGTPFDEKINETFDSWRTQQKKNNMPFITLLRASHGVINDYIVNTPPWQLELPPLPAELLPPPKPAGVRLPAESPKAPAGIRLPSESPKGPTTSALIVSGHTTNPTPTSDPNIIVVTANSNSSTNPATNIANSSPVTQIAATQPVKAPEQTPATPPGVVPVMASEIAKSNAPATVTTATSTPPIAVVATVPATATPAAQNPSPAFGTDNHTAARGDDSSAKSAIPTPTAMGVFSGGILSPRNLFIVVGFLVVIMIIMMVAKARQPQEPAGRISLITRSLDQEQR